jgi:ketosteroid isomerase-like protein
MAPSDALAVVHRLFDAGEWSPETLERHADDVWHPDIEYAPLEEPDRTIRGPDALSRYYASWSDVFGSAEVEVLETELLDTDEVLVHLCVRGAGRASGTPFEFAFWSLYAVEDGRVRSIREYRERPGAS